MKTAIVLTAMKEEQQWLLEHCQTVTQLESGLFETTLGGSRLLLARCGVGKVNAAICCTKLQEKYQPDSLLMIGCAASLQENSKQGDIVVAEQIAYHDADVSAFGYPAGQLPGLPQFFQSATKWLDQAKQLLTDEQQQWSAGLLLSGDQFIDNNSSYLAAIKRNFPQALAVEMEGAAVAHSCHCLQLPFLIIRIISDTIGPQADNKLQFEQFIRQSSTRKFAQLALKLATGYQ